MNLIAGDNHIGSFKVINPTDADHALHYKISVVPFSVESKDYDVNLEDETPYSQIAK